MKIKKILSLLTALFVTVSMVACGGGNESSENTTVTTTVTSDTLLDLEGNELVIPDEINTIISASASNSEILVGLGLGDKIIATDTYSTDIDGISSSVIQFDMQNLDMEQVIALAPDAIFLNEINYSGEEDKYAPLKSAGINVVYIPAASTIQEIKDGIAMIAEYTGTEEKGAQMIAEIQSVIDDVKSKWQILSSNPPSVYLEISPAPWFYSTGSGTYLNEIIEICGGVNIYAGEQGWLANTEESIIQGNPDIILTNCAYEGYDFNEIFDRAGWGELNAVKNNKVFYVDTNSTSRASQNITKGILEIAKAIHPELYE